MKNLEFDAARVKLAQVRYFNLERKSSAMMSEKAYAVLINVNGTYINILNPVEELPVFGRAPYPNTTSKGLEFGNLLFLVNGELCDGPCFILEKRDLGHELGKKKLTIKDIENYVLSSDNFFVDRIKLLEDGKKVPKGISKRRLLEQDSIKLDMLNEYFLGQSNGIQYRKK